MGSANRGGTIGPILSFTFADTGRRRILQSESILPTRGGGDNLKMLMGFSFDDSVVKREGSAYDKIRKGGKRSKEKTKNEGLLLPPLMASVIYLYEICDELRFRLAKDYRIRLRYPHNWKELESLQCSYHIWKKKNDFITLIRYFEDLELMADDLVLALQHRQHVFTDDLMYTRHLPESRNDPALEKGSVVFRHRDCAIYELSKAFTTCGVYSPLLFLWDSKLGVYLATTCKLKKKTLIAEYSGVVEPLRWSVTKAENRCDSIYELLTPGDSAFALSVVPETHTNIARFIAGINDRNRRSACRQNLVPQRNNIRGTMHILISTCKNTEANAALWMNYNANKSNYPTDDFE
eukprot:GHVO01022103.1.p1 GENE.GHVO01022103.1~~GHVO01022103.1.p1  ORF type:complete len:350 (-),score=50.04 GHVO01022103.1:334-1383(-)